jgi:hypothetical protein
MTLTVEQIANRITHILRADQDICIAVTADEGRGKSTLAIAIAQAMDKSFSLERNVIFNPKFSELKNRMIGLPPETPIIADEAMAFLFKHYWNTKTSKQTSVFMTKARQENKALFLLLPKLSDLTPFFRNRRVSVWIHIIKGINKEENEGKAIVFVKSRSPFAEEDIWHYKENQALIDNYCRSKRISESLLTWDIYAHVLSRSRNYLGIVDFTHMPDELFQKYKMLKKKNAYEDVNDVEDSVSKREQHWVNRTVLLVDYLHKSCGKTYEEIGKVLGVTMAAVSMFMLREEKKEKERGEEQRENIL